MICLFSIKQLSENLKVETYTASNSIKNDKDVFSFRIKKYIYKNRIEYEVYSDVGSDFSDIGHNKPVLESTHQRFQEIYNEAQAYYQDLFGLKGGHS